MLISPSLNNELLFAYAENIICLWQIANSGSIKPGKNFSLS
jgi:hypothetical protein